MQENAEAKAIQHLLESGQAKRALAASERAAWFSLPNDDGVVFHSQALLRRGPLVVIFYRGWWCDFCSVDLQAVERARVSIESLGAGLVAISQQTPAEGLTTRQRNGLRFPLLSDADGKVADAFGLRWKLPACLPQQEQGRCTLAIPASYVIAPDGIVVYAEVNPDYTRRPDPGELLPALERIRAATRRREHGI